MKAITRHIGPLIVLALSATVLSKDDAPSITCKIGGTTKSFHELTSGAYSREKGLEILGLTGDSKHGELISIRVPVAQAGTYSLKETPGLFLLYTQSIFSSDSADSFQADVANKECRLNVTIAKIGDVGETVEGTFSAVAVSGPKGRELTITDGRFSVIRGIPEAPPKSIRDQDFSVGSASARPPSAEAANSLAKTTAALGTDAQQTNPAAASDPMPETMKKPGEIKLKHEPFTFVRIKYSGFQGSIGGYLTDFPDADLNFTKQFQEVTGWKSSPNGLVLKLTDPMLKQHPFIYIAEGGQMHLTDNEVSSLRDYLLGGGFLMVDDFWGEPEWESLAGELRRVFPNREPIELPLSHDVFSCFYEIRKKPQIPNALLGTESQFTGVTWERKDAKEPHYRGLFDESGRLMAILCHNTDLGDGWEHDADGGYYHREFSLKKAFPMGINIVVYALSH